MLSTIRGKFAAVLFLGLGLVCAGAFGLSSGQQAGADAAFGEPALFVGMLTLVVMLLIERIVIQPISGLTRGVVLLANGDPGDPATVFRSRARTRSRRSPARSTGSWSTSRRARSSRPNSRIWPIMTA
jgi:hypothetical protein